MSFDYGLRLTAPAPCEGRGIEYAANIFVATSTRGAVVRRVGLDERYMDPTPDLLRQYSDKTIAKLDREERQRVIAINYFKLCVASPHKRLQLERVGAVAFTHHEPQFLPIEATTLKTNNGIGSIRCGILGSKLLQPVIDFAITETERFTHQPKMLATAGITVPGRSAAYIVVRGIETAVGIR